MVRVGSALLTEKCGSGEGSWAAGALQVTHTCTESSLGLQVHGAAGTPAGAFMGCRRGNLRRPAPTKRFLKGHRNDPVGGHCVMFFLDCHTRADSVLVCSHLCLPGLKGSGAGLWLVVVKGWDLVQNPL